MNNLLIRQNLQVLLVGLVILLFAILYWQTVMTLPLFGDATIHGANALDLVEKNWYGLKADYPPFYSFFMASLYSIFGEIGFNLVVYTGFAFLIASIFLLVRQITHSYYSGLLALAMVASSPKIIFYSARMYQEILIAAFFIFTLYLLFKYVSTKSTKLLILLCVFIGISMSIKQQGLFILYSSISLWAVIWCFLKRISLAHLFMLLVIPAAISLPFYGVLYHTTGEIYAGGDEFKVFTLINSIGQKVFSYNQQNTITLSDDLTKELNSIQNQYYFKINSHGESKHIWPLDVFTNFDKFNQANSLYVDFQGKQLENKLFFYLSFIGIILGVGVALSKYKQYLDLLIFTLIFLPINYLLFLRNADQQRYHVFLPIFLLVYVFLFLNFLYGKLNIKFRKQFVLVLILFFSFVSLFFPRIMINRNWGQSQIYTPSVGGIDSIKEAAVWLRSSTAKNQIIGQQCGDEIAYYSRRNTVGDWRIYLLSPTLIREYFKEENISHYVIYESQIVPDDKWASICWVPESFALFMDKNFKKVFQTKEGDISIYEI